jgi:hypothetical protein
MNGNAAAASVTKTTAAMNSVNPRKFLQTLLPQLRDELASALTRDLKGATAAKSQGRIRRLFDYTMADGKFSRSSLALNTYMVCLIDLKLFYRIKCQALDPSTSEEQMVKAGKVAATIEMVYPIIEET